MTEHERRWEPIPPSLTKLMAYEEAVASLAQAKESIKRLKEGAVLSEWDELDKIQNLVDVARCRLRTLEDDARRKIQEAKE